MIDKLKDLISKSDKGGVKSILRSIEEELLNQAKDIVLESGLIPRKSVLGIIRFRDPEVRKRRSEGAKKQWNNPGSRERIIEGRLNGDKSHYHEVMIARWKSGKMKPPVPKGSKMSESHREALAESNRRRARPHTPEELRKMSESHKGIRREVRNHRSHTVSGYSIDYELNGSAVRLDSTYELYCIQHYRKLGVELMRSRRRFSYFIEGDDFKHHYYPDFEYTDEKGILHILEVKPSNRVKESLVQLKASAVGKFISTNRLNWTYEIFTELDFSTEELEGFNDTRIIRYKLPYSKSRKREWIYPSCLTSSDN